MGPGSISSINLLCKAVWILSLWLKEVFLLQCCLSVPYWAHHLTAWSSKCYTIFWLLANSSQSPSLQLVLEARGYRRGSLHMMFISISSWALSVALCTLSFLSLFIVPWSGYDFIMVLKIKETSSHIINQLTQAVTRDRLDISRLSIRSIFFFHFFIA